MTRELIAALLLALLIVCAVWNISAVNSLTCDIIACVDRSEEAVLRGDGQLARASLERGLTLWLKADSYTHIFIRHSEIDNTTDAFYEAMMELSDNDSEALSQRTRS